MSQIDQSGTAMLLMYITCGIGTGLISATTAFLFGADLTMTALAYALGGLIGMAAGLVWSCLPRQTCSLEQPKTERG